MSFEAEESQNSRTSSEESVSHNLSSSEEVTVLTNASSDEENLANQEAVVLDLLSDINDNPDFDPPLVTEDVESVNLRISSFLKYSPTVKILIFRNYSEKLNFRSLTSKQLLYHPVLQL